MRLVYRRQIPSWYLYPRLKDLFTVHSARRVCYNTNELFNPDLFTPLDGLPSLRLRCPIYPMVLEVNKNSAGTGGTGLTDYQ